jgi:cob(I)alamin adenosyltransferase
MKRSLAGTIDVSHVAQLESWISQAEAGVQMPREFVIPGDSRPGAALHVARTVVRRAERLVVRLIHDSLLDNSQVVRYLNRLSSLLFVLAVYEDQRATAEALTLAKEGGDADGD